MAINQDDNGKEVGSVAEQAMQVAGEAILTRLRQELPAGESADEPMRVLTDVDDSTQPASTELQVQHTAGVRGLYEQLPVEEQVALFNAVRQAATVALNRVETAHPLTERDVFVYVYGDQSAVELARDQYRLNEPMLLPTLRAICWQRPLLLVGDDQRPTDYNLFRMGYQELGRTTDTTLYRHYDLAMPMIGYGFAAGSHHLTVFNAGQPPVIISVSQDGQSKGQLIDLRQPMPANSLLDDQKVASIEPVAEDKTRYPASLLDQVANQFDVLLTGDNAKRLLNGQKTAVIITGDGSTGKLYVLNTPDNGPKVVLQDVRRELTLKDSYLGHVFTEKDKENLIKYGNMGRAVELTDKQSGQPFTGFVGVDEDTKTLTVLRADQIRPKIERMSNLKGVPLTGLQKKQLMDGKAIRLDNMTSKAGTLFSAYVRVSAAGRNLRFDPISSASGQTPKAGPERAAARKTKPATDDPTPAPPTRRIAKPKPLPN